MAKAVTKTTPPQKQELAGTQINADLAELFGGTGTGLENVTATDLLIPRLTILQGLSPQVTQGKPEFDPNAKVGMIYDTGLQEGFPDGIEIIPVHYVKQYLEWAPRASGKGLVAIHDTADILEQTTKDEKKRSVLSNGNYIAETAQFYCLNVTAGFRKSFIPMTSTQLKKARRLLTLATAEEITLGDGKVVTPPLFYRVYHLTTVPESNNEGNWMGWKVERGVTLDQLPNWQRLAPQITNFRDALTKGDIVGDIQAMADEVNQTIDHEKGAM